MYPSGKPSKYSYTQHFVDEFGGRTGYLAEAHTRYPGINPESGTPVIDRALNNLNALIKGARAAEQAFLVDTGIKIENLQDASSIFRSINLILNSKDTFERGIKYLKQMSVMNSETSKNQTYRDVSRYFGTYLEQVLKKRLENIDSTRLLSMTTTQMEKLVNQIISDALIESYKKVKDFIKSNGNIRGKFGKYSKAHKDETSVQAVTDMIEVIKQLRNTNAFSQFGYLFDLNTTNLLNYTKDADVKLKKQKSHDVKFDSQYGGNALELITSLITAQIANTNITTGDLTIVGKHTGQDNQMKADTLLFVGNGTINPDDYIEYVDKDASGDSVRVQNVDALDSYLKKLQENVKHVIAISDKNYSIKADFNGIHAQEKMSLDDIGTLLSRFGVGEVQKLIDYLANCGDKMIQGDVNGEVRTTLQTYIGYFLFDHLEITGNQSNVNVVNLLNVSGIYIPLSVYLEKLYLSIKNAMANASGYVSVSISLGGPTEQPIWTESTWNAFRQDHEKQSFLEYRILNNLADLIAGL